MNFSLDILGRFCYNVGFFKGENWFNIITKNKKIVKRFFLLTIEKLNLNLKFYAIAMIVHFDV